MKPALLLAFFALLGGALSVAPPPLRIEIPVLEIRGHLALGREPLAAALWFGGKPGAPRVRIDADENGRFQGLLPSEGTWPVEVVNEARGLRQALRPVEIKKRPGERWAEVDLVLPDTLVCGEVVDQAGHQATGADVSATTSAERIRTRIVTDEAGRFSLRGLPPGPTAFEAESAGATSGPTAFVVEDGHESPFLRLTLRARTVVRGHILGPQGPVAGAEVLAWPNLGAAAVAGLESSVTGPDGAFRVAVPASSRTLHLVIVAPGYALRLLAAPIEPDRPLEVPVDSQGGTLVIALRPSGANPLLAHNGTYALLQLLGRWVTPQGGTGGSEARLVLENAEPGDYSLCGAATARSGSAAGCQGGSLSAGGELVLRAHPL